MKKVILVILFFLILSGTLWAETVLIYITKADGSPFSEVSLPLAYAFEGGVMDEFFEAGHIIFNAGIKNASLQKDFPVYMAKEEGASLLLEIALACQEKDTIEDSNLSSAAYRFLLVDELRTLAEGILYSDGTGEDGVGLEESSFLFGKRIALQSLGSM